MEQLSRKSLALCLLCVLCVFVVNHPVIAQTTYRGNPQRTGNTDGLPGPTAAKVLWVFQTREHIVASPVAVGDRLFVSGLGAFNVPSLYCLSVDPKAAQRTIWTKSAPFLKLPTVSSPAVADGKLVFGDGMHQTDGATLYCMQLDKGMPLWQLRRRNRIAWCIWRDRPRSWINVPTSAAVRWA